MARRKRRRKKGFLVDDKITFTDARIIGGIFVIFLATRFAWYAFTPWIESSGFSGAKAILIAAVLLLISLKVFGYGGHK